jgi:predicted nucleotidyltransferase
VNFFERTFTALFEGGVNFVVIGGVAVSAHGSAHVTFDLDICYARSQKNIQCLVNALKPYHPRLRGAPEDLPFRFDSETIRRGLNFTFTTDLGDLDILGEVKGIGQYKEALAHSRNVELFGREFRVLSLGGLIAAKRASARPRDLAIIPELEALLELEFLNSKAGHDSSKTTKSVKRKEGRRKRRPRG